MPLLLGGLLLAAGSAQAASVPIYKCLDRNLGLVYTDLPCKDGEKLDLRAGDSDPAAVAALERERERLSVSAAQRLADERYASLQRDLASGYYRDSPVVQPSAPEVSDYGYGYPVAYPRRAHPRAHHHPVAASRAAPNPPHVIPRP
jgi:hypothetical protein